MNKYIEKSKLFIQQHKTGLTAGAIALMGVLLSAPTYASGLDTVISNAQSQFTATTGFSMADLVTKVGTWMLMILGGGLGLIDSVIGWIIALVVLGVVISLIYRALRFLHILKN